MYNKMVEKEGTDGEAEALKAYKAAREESDHAAEVAIADKVSSALINRVSFNKLCYNAEIFVCPLILQVYDRLMQCFKNWKKKLMMWMPKLAIAGSYLTGAIFSLFWG